MSVFSESKSDHFRRRYGQQQLRHFRGIDFTLTSTSTKMKQGDRGQRDKQETFWSLPEIK